MKNKNINAPNIISASRFFLLPIPFIFLYLDMRTAFLIAYILIGSTDYFDGLVARKFNMLTEVGKKLDSFSDLFFYLASAWFLYKLHNPYVTATPNAALILTYLGLLALSFVISGIFCKKPIMMHTILAKVDAVLLYLAVILSEFFDTTHYITVLAILFIIAIVEGIVIFIKFGDIDPDSKSFFHLLKESREKDASEETEDQE